MEVYDVIVIGGGASGMMAAGRAGEAGKRVLLLERNSRLGEKLHISGGGRCNILNAEPDTRALLTHYGDAEPFLHSAFSQFSMTDTYAFFESNGLPLVVQARNRAFPKSEKALDVVRFLEAYMKRGGVTVRTGEGVRSIEAEQGVIIGVTTLRGMTYHAHSYILATGGLSHPETGSTGDGFDWLRVLGHTIVAPTPTIVPLRTKEAWTHKLAGIALPTVRVTFQNERGTKFKRDGALLFTHEGVSGPVILNAAGEVADLLHEAGVVAHLDLFPTEDIGTLDRRVTALFDQNKNKLVRNACREWLPPGVTDALLSQLPDLSLNTLVHSVKKEQRKELVKLVKDISLTVTGLMGFDKAVVADGGVPLAEVDTKTMRSKRVSNLFITGDLLTIRRPSGGYSLQLCWTTGYVAGLHS